MPEKTLKVIIAPSILNAKWWKVKKQLRILEKLGAHYLHFDVMDGKFVPNVSFDEKKLKKLNKFTHMINDVHLMVADPKSVIRKYVENKADIITVHYESFKNDEDVINCLNYIHSFKIKAGLSIKPHTQINVLDKFLPYVDQILVMSVEPGEGGQPFMENSYSRIARIKQKIVESHYYIKIEVDGGINDSNAKKICESGADILVVGSYLFLSNDIKNSMEKLCSGLSIGQ